MAGLTNHLQTSSDRQQQQNFAAAAAATLNGIDLLNYR